MMIVGLAITAPVAAIEGVPASLHGSAAVWLAVSGAGNVIGLMITYAAMRIGQVALVAPLVSTEGAIAALIAIARRRVARAGGRRDAGGDRGRHLALRRARRGRLGGPPRRPSTRRDAGGAGGVLLWREPVRDGSSRRRRSRRPGSCCRRG